MVTTSVEAIDEAAAAAAVAPGAAAAACEANGAGAIASVTAATVWTTATSSPVDCGRLLFVDLGFLDRLLTVPLPSCDDP